MVLPSAPMRAKWHSVAAWCGAERVPDACRQLELRWRRRCWLCRQTACQECGERADSNDVLDGPHLDTSALAGLSFEAAGDRCAVAVGCGADDGAIAAVPVAPCAG